MLETLYSSVIILAAAPKMRLLQKSFCLSRALLAQYAESLSARAHHRASRNTYYKMKASPRNAHAAESIADAEIDK